ncbi:Aste57867_23282 [Aphanomyces stellatus]|uniref:Aste57867_23282 protein n=1 Tax=Aphanomyces stellatus TaxID=120398 RepID=A0A485LME1_9STRA|nr:hypothetical protein As57867_023211 [Aphanomyces stellatus]VFT99927.1 Aste57867_23282 [Aphanomyces stellatus]
MEEPPKSNSTASALWGAFTNVASYGKDLTQDLRGIVAGSDRTDGDSALPAADDEDVDAYIEDLERSLIRKKQEAEAAHKQIQELQAQLALRPSAVSDTPRMDELQKDMECLRLQLDSEKRMHAEALDAKETTWAAQVAAAEQETRRLREESHQLRARLATAPTDVVAESDATMQAVDDAVSTLSTVLTAADVDNTYDDSTATKLTKYVGLVSSRLIALEVDAKALKNTLHAFLLSQNERVDAFSLPECKLKLEAISQKRMTDHQRITQLEASLGKLQSRVHEMETAAKSHNSTLASTHEMLERARRDAKDAAQKDETIRQLQDKVNQLQRNTEHLSHELEATTTELQQVQAAQAAAAETSMETTYSVMDRNSELERMVYSLTEELKQAKETHQADQAQWVHHMQANTSAVTEAQWFEMSTRLELLETDKRVAEQDADRLYTELTNLQAVLTQFQSDRVAEDARWRAKVEEITALGEARAQEAEGRAAATQGISSDEYSHVVAALTKKEHECDRLRDALERSAAHLEGDNIDKRMVVQMMIQYHESPNKSDVLEVMGRILGFTAADKDRLLAHPGRIKSIPLLGSLFGSDAPPTQPMDVEGKSFTDAWADFLLKETK